MLKSIDLCDSLSFPPMDKHARKIIHEIANKLQLKSKSTGNAEHRRPMLYRTLRTFGYQEAMFEKVVKRASRQFLPRLDVKGKRKKIKPMAGGVSMAAATIRDGEVVGGTAPELGIENRGRNMLERMGWSTGTALGTESNKGILQPVTHTMKKSKTGLG